MLLSCPGNQKFRQASPESIKCASCGADAEIWTDESQTTCQNCKSIIKRKANQCCLGWCKYAKECAGKDVYNAYMKK